MINMFSQMVCICHFVFLMSYPEPSMGISSVGSFPVQSGGPLNIFQLLRCRNLALNRDFPIFFSGRYVLHLGGVWMLPVHSAAPCMFGCPHMFKHPHMSPMLPCASACFGGYLHVIGGFRALLCLDPACVWMPPHVSNTPMHLYTPLYVYMF